MEAELLTGETDFARGACRLAEYGPREIVLTQSSGLTVLVDGKVDEAPFTRARSPAAPVVATRVSRPISVAGLLCCWKRPAGFPPP